MTASRTTTLLIALCLGTLSTPSPATAQAAPAATEGAPSARRAELLSARGNELLEREDPVAALDVFRELRAVGPDQIEGLVGLGRTHLLLGRPWIALRYADAALGVDADDDAALALSVRAHLRARLFREALRRSTAAVRAGRGGVRLLAAHASALFRMQRTEEAAEAYRAVLDLDPDHPEAHLRLGSGLSRPRAVTLSPAFDAGVRAARAGQLPAALLHLRRALAADPGNPVVHRLIGETIFSQRADTSMASSEPAFRALHDALGEPELDERLATEFMPAYGGLGPSRRRVAARALALFEGHLRPLLAKRARHDLLLEAERTTDHASRANLRGKRTFDGRVWDDVRGIGGLRAATGIEALDEAVQHGFDTLSHEIAHQVHLHAVSRSVRARIRRLYRDALREGRCLDYYAASNFAEYFGQGVEAFASLGKRPTHEATHGHTRFELMRVDPALHELIVSLVSVDPLDPRGDPQRRAVLLRHSIAIALRCGRPADAVTAARLLTEGPRRDLLLQHAQRALLLSRSF